MKTVAELASKVAEYFNTCITEGEYENFKEMKQNYDWDAYDIRCEIMTCIRDYCNEDYKTWQNANPDKSPWEHSGVDYYNDGTVTGDDGEFTYGQFKKLVMKEVA